MQTTRGKHSLFNKSEPHQADNEEHHCFSPTCSGSHQSAYRTKRSTDLISNVFHTVLTLFEQHGCYFWTMVLHSIPSFATDCSTRYPTSPSFLLSLSTGAPQGCVLSPFCISYPQITVHLPIIPMSELNANMWD